jgi:glucose-1-phosphate thymidylyltransferase
MRAVVLAAGRGSRLAPLTDDRPKGLVEVAGEPILTHCFERLVDLGVDAIVAVVGYRKERIIERYGDSFRGVPITYAHQREPLGLAHALVTAEPFVADDFVVMLGDNVFHANLADVVRRQRETDADAAFLVEEVPREAASRYGVCVTNGDGEILDVVEKPTDPPSTLVMTGFYAFSPAVFDACRLVQPSARGEYELTDAVHLLLESGRRVDAVPLDGWRVDVGYPEDRDRAERLLRETNAADA